MNRQGGDNSGEFKIFWKILMQAFKDKLKMLRFFQL